jgi:radical SAM superfamily enzyme YgiQ (UPF0313 family)
MAKILFISVNDVNAEGIRSLSANLQKNNHITCIIFLKKLALSSSKLEGYDWVGINVWGRKFRYARGSEITGKEKTILINLIKEIKPDLIGITVVTPLKKRIAEVTELIKQNFTVPVIWGGPEPTINPEDCLKYCDIVHIGEADRSILDIATAIDEGRDLKSAGNLAFLENGTIVRNPLHPLVADLDKLPYKDIHPENKFLIENNVLIRNYNEVSYKGISTYFMISSRGCPYNCSYCCENFYKRLYLPLNFLRRRSPLNVIQELKEAKKVIDYNNVRFEDEVFSLENEWLQEFKDLYKKEINCPFTCYIHPHKSIEKQLEILKEAGLVSTCLAIQSGSERINREIFNRNFNREMFLKTAGLLKAMGISFYTDIITFNPAEKEEDLQATLDIVNRLPRPFGMCINKLYVNRGTKVYDVIDNLIDGKGKGLVPERIFMYYARLFWLTTMYERTFVDFIIKIKMFRRFLFLFDMFVCFSYVRRAIKKPQLAVNKLMQLLKKQ